MIITDSKQSVKEWVEEFSDELYKWAFHKTSDVETSRDLVQDTFLAAVKSYDKFEGKSSPKTWLFSILNNKIADYYRKEYKQIIIRESDLMKKESEHSFFSQSGCWKEPQRPASWPIEDESLLDDKGFKIQLASCLQALPPAWNKAIKMKYLSDVDGKDICQEIGISKTNYWQILHRAKLQLRKCLEVNWFKI
ncbi:MAG: sigma-70 family RNA polymerase sigma factor [Bacteroidetes bacterium]|nr:sigma-70 family RNA polymerase sigma factor [Bacteroidota bacterium]